VNIEERSGELAKLHAEVFGTAERAERNGQVARRPIHLDDAALIRRALDAANGDKLRRLLEGDWTGYASQSEAELALMDIAAFWTGCDAGRMDNWYRQSKFPRDKWDERHSGDGRTYGEMTIEKAIEGCRETYSEPRWAASLRPVADAEGSVTPSVTEAEDVLHPESPEATSAGTPTRRFALTDLGNAERLVHHFGADLHYCHPWARWLHWDGKRWRPDYTGRIYRMAKEVVRAIYVEAAQAEDEDERKALVKHALKSEGKYALKAMVELAQSEPGIPIEPNELDADRWLLNVLNGTVDLRSGVLLDHRREDLLTKLAPVEYDPAAACPTWRAFLGDIMADPDGRPKRRLIAFLRRTIGYCLTGSTAEQVLLMGYGTGSNGKSTFLEAIRGMLGDYAQQADFGTFLARDHDRIPNDIARLKGVRFVSAVEVEGTRRLAEVLVKQLTGGDTVTARFLFQDFFEFKPTLKVFVAVNHKPQIRGTDWAIWRRIRLIPFTVTIPDDKQDKRLPEKLRAELPGILAWAVRGCLVWQRKGLGLPEEVKKATAEYREEMDILGGFLAERCRLDGRAVTPATELYKAYVEWCEQGGEEPIKQTTFGTRLTERGIQRRRNTSTGRREYLGIGLVTTTEQSEGSERFPG
jgi:putative DNA primase/helicase